MSITCNVLGHPGRDNCLLVTVDTGQSRHQLLFDCGGDCLEGLPIRDVQSIEGLFFSHYHIDHIAGFDTFLRHNFGRPGKPVRIWGPQGTIELIGHRLQGVTWNLVEACEGVWFVNEIRPDCVEQVLYRANEGFAVRHPTGAHKFAGVVYEGPTFTVEAVLLDHGVPCAGYLLREHQRQHIDMEAMHRRHLVPGPWLQRLKGPEPDEASCDSAGQHVTLGELRRCLLRTTPGAAVAYLTDFRVTEPQETLLVEWLHGCQTIICENNFCNSDVGLAIKSRHLVSRDVGRIASRAGAQELIIIHLSDRYRRPDWQDLLDEVRAEFPNARFPEHWKLT